MTPYVSAFIYVRLITALVCLYYPGDLTVAVVPHLQGAEVSISRNYALKSIIKYLEFLIEIPGSPVDKSHRTKAERPPRKCPVMRLCLEELHQELSRLVSVLELPRARDGNLPMLLSPASENGPRWCFLGVESFLLSRPPWC